MALLIVAGASVAFVARCMWERVPAQSLEFLSASALHMTAPPVYSYTPRHALRPVYPYSVIPGGVYDSKEVSSAVAADPVAREHYKDIRLDALRTVRTEKPMLVYVSYRKENRVAWTSHKIMIPKGEAVLTDGKNLIRARCGNRVRELPAPLASEVLSQADEPTIIFESSSSPSLEPLATLPPPVPPRVLLASNEPSNLLPLVSPTPTATTPVVDTTPVARASQPAYMPPSGPSYQPLPKTPTKTPTQDTPEPSTLVLLALGLGGLSSCRRK